MKRHGLRWAALCLAAALLLSGTAMADTIGGATVTGNYVRLRSSADTDDSSNIITQMEEGEFLLVEEKLSGWYKVLLDGIPGYVSADFAAFSEILDGTYDFSGASTAGTDVYLRSAATTASMPVKLLPLLGTQVSVCGVSGRWLKVTDETGAVGYIRSDLVNYSGSAKGKGMLPAASEGERIVQTALLYKGYAYRCGGMSPSTGFDCSGLVNYVYEQYGYDLHRTAQDIYSYDGELVSKDALCLGDVLCFGYGTGSITHVGIYIGNGEMVHASTSTTGVIISDIDSNYYTRMYVGAKRIAD